MDEELEKTNLLKTLFIDQEEVSLSEKIEEFEDKLDYLDIPEKKKNKIKELCEKIKKEENEEVKENLFDLLKIEVK